MVKEKDNVNEIRNSLFILRIYAIIKAKKTLSNLGIIIVVTY